MTLLCLPVSQAGSPLRTRPYHVHGGFFAAWHETWHLTDIKQVFTEGMDSITGPGEFLTCTFLLDLKTRINQVGQNSHSLPD